MRAMVMVVSYSGFGGIAVDAPGSMPVHRLQSLLKLPIGDRLIAEAIFGHLEIGRPFLEATFTDLAEGFGMAARRRISGNDRLRRFKKSMQYGRLILRQ